MKALKVTRRLSARVGGFFKSKPKEEHAVPPKVDENPPKIDEPTPVAPLENPATEATPETPAAPVEAEKAVEEPKPVDTTPVAPVVAATA